MRLEADHPARTAAQRSIPEKDFGGAKFLGRLLIPPQGFGLAKSTHVRQICTLESILDMGVAPFDPGPRVRTFDKRSPTALRWASLIVTVRGTRNETAFLGSRASQPQRSTWRICAPTAPAIRRSLRPMAVRLEQ